MFEKFFAKYNKETKVKADKFADTLNRVTAQKEVSSINSQKQPMGIVKPIPPQDFSKNTSNQTSINNKNVQDSSNNEFKDELSNLFGSSNSQKENAVNYAEEYCKTVIESVLRQIKADLAPHGRDVRVNVNNILLLGSASVHSRGRNEYDYIIQIRKGASNQTTTVTVKESGLRGGYDVRPSISSRKIEELNKEDFTRDFLDGYKRYMKFKGWL
jgi:hypothetical protein